MVWWPLPWELVVRCVVGLPERQVEMPRPVLELLLDVEAAMKQFVNTGSQLKG
jgi:hypothetical protein